MRAATDTTRAVIAIAVCLVMALGGQALGDAVVPADAGVDTTRAVGRAADSYLTGLRTYVAAGLWNRLDPLMHEYYADLPLTDQVYMLSTIAAVQALDPHAVRSYFTGAWLLARNDRVEDGIAMAQRGVDDNPREGILYMSLAQIVALFTDDVDRAVAAGEAALGPDIRWLNAEEQHTAYVVLGEIFRAAGRQDLSAIVVERLKTIDEAAGENVPAGEHDHDGDGVSDH